MVNERERCGEGGGKRRCGKGWREGEVLRVKGEVWRAKRRGGKGRGMEGKVKREGERWKVRGRVKCWNNATKTEVYVC